VVRGVQFLVEEGGGDVDGIDAGDTEDKAESGHM
jgi:hypothetical protein